MKLEPGYIPAGTTTVNVSPVVGARTLSCEPGNAPGGTVTAKWPSMVVSVRLTGPCAATGQCLQRLYGAVTRLNSGPCSVRGYTGPFSVARLFTAVGTADGQL